MNTQTRGQHAVAQHRRLEQERVEGDVCRVCDDLELGHVEARCSGHLPDARARVGAVSHCERIGAVASVNIRDELLLQPRRELAYAVAHHQRIQRVGREEDEVPARLEHARDLGKHVLRSLEMLQHPHAHDHVEGRVREGQVLPAALQHGHPLAAGDKRAVVGVDADGEARIAPEALDTPGAAAAQVQHCAFGRQVLLHHQVELVAARHPAGPGGAVLLSVGGLGGVGKQGTAGHRWWRDYAPRASPPSMVGLIDRLSVRYYLAMARTLDLEKHTVRKDAFVEAAQRLLQTKGYEAMTIQDLLEELGASRGAFYHYFDSKQALLVAVVTATTDAALATVAPVMDDAGLPAADKLTRVFSDIGRWKTERRALVLSLMEVWLSDENAIFREKIRERLMTRMVPLLTRIVREGIAEGPSHRALRRTPRWSW